jgi:hypothetical protein
VIPRGSESRTELGLVRDPPDLEAFLDRDDERVPAIGRPLQCRRLGGEEVVAICGVAAISVSPA